MPYDNAESFNQTLTQVLNGEHANAINQFCQSFIATFNADMQAAKMIGTGKLEMSSSKKEEAAQMAATGTLDVAGVFKVPTGLLGDVVKKSISALFKGVRKKGYKKVAGIKAHMTHMELISEALALGLIVHYKDELLDVDTLSDPKKWGKKTAKRLLRSLKSKKENSLTLKEQDTLLQQLKSLFEWCVKKDYIREEPEPKQKMPQVFIDDDYSTLLLFASAELLGLPRDHFVQAQNTEAKANELLAKIESMEQEFETLTTVVKQCQEARPKDVITIVSKNAKVLGTLNVSIGSLTDVVSTRAPTNKEQRDYYLQEFQTALSHSKEMMQMIRESIAQRDRDITVLAEDAVLPAGSTTNVGIDSYTAPVLGGMPASTTPPSPPPATGTQDNAAYTETPQQQPTTPSTGTPAPGE